MESNESPKQLLAQRLQELHQKLKLASHRMNELVDSGLVDTPATMDQDQLELVINTIGSTNAISADSRWVGSMLDLEIPEKIILDVWDKKEEKSFNVKNPKNPQSE